MGELTEVERLEVERNLKKYPELQHELALIEATMEAFLVKAGREPRAHVKEKVLTAATPVRKLENTGSNVAMWKYAAAASIVIAFASSFMAYSFWSNWKETEVSLMELRALNDQVARDYNQVNQRLGDIETQMQVMNNPSFQRVILKGTESAPQALASIYWNQASQEVYLSVQNLKALAKDQQYQLWAIVDGKPVDMGVFDSPAGQAGATALNGLLKMKTTGKAAAFAVTIEPRGGKSSPSLETMQVLGNT